MERARQLYKESNRSFVLGSAEHLPFDDQTFDAIFSVAVLHLLPNIESACKELSRALKPAGSFLTISANPDAYNIWKRPYTNIHSNGHLFVGDI